ncbi:DUF1990 family protein [Deinococcus cavernae]|uniref:DUF1990 family protein n=1 Tax=Deinococcus cavernae TaxID=2320857 RepID=A0A418VB55_9DEIO|nr:DUF1990 family protein [Deinococcus cavernae]RJF73279.1 DUF1990 family protein [Deinococcus cavernae]
MAKFKPAFGGPADHARLPAPAAVAGWPYARHGLKLLDYRWVKRPPGGFTSRLQSPPERPFLPHGLTASETPPELTHLSTQPLNLEFSGTRFTGTGFTGTVFTEPQPTLEDSVIEALIRALYDALPDTLAETDALAQTTASGTLLGRHGNASRPTSEEPRRPSPSSVPATGAPASVSPAASGTPPVPAPEPRPYVIGSPPEGLPAATLRSLTRLDIRVPPDRTAGVIRGQAELGQGEPCFLRAQSALWSWRTHRQANMDIHSHGPPLPGRNALVEQKIGPVTLLLGCRVLDMVEEPRRWGFTLVSLDGQVLLLRETFLVDWQPDNRVVFSLSTQQFLAMPNLTFLAPVHAALRRKFKQEYIRNMQEMTAD